MIQTGINRGGKVFYGTSDFLCDYQSDVSDLPTNRRPGSRATVIENGNFYILNSNKQWILQPKNSGGSGGSGGGSSTGEDDITVLDDTGTGSSSSAENDIVMLKDDSSPSDDSILIL